MTKHNVDVSADIDLRMQNLESEAKTSILISVDGEISGILAIADQIKVNISPSNLRLFSPKQKLQSPISALWVSRPGWSPEITSAPPMLSPRSSDLPTCSPKCFPRRKLEKSKKFEYVHFFTKC